MFALTSVEVTAIHALFEIKHTLIVFHQVAQLFSKLQGHVLQGGGLCAMHHHSLCGLVQRCLVVQENALVAQLLSVNFVQVTSGK